MSRRARRLDLRHLAISSVTSLKTWPETHADRTPLLSEPCLSKRPALLTANARISNPAFLTSFFVAGFVSVLSLRDRGEGMRSGNGRKNDPEDTQGGDDAGQQQD